MITSKQYRRQLKQEGGNNPGEIILKDLKKYNELVNKFLPAEHESYEKYFHMSMDYYTLESYKRIEFMFKLIESLPQSEIEKISKDHFLVKRFHPLVLVLCEKNGELYLTTKHNYYRPLLIMEDGLLREIKEENAPDYSNYGI